MYKMQKRNLDCKGLQIVRTLHTWHKVMEKEVNVGNWLRIRRKGEKNEGGEAGNN